MSKTKSISDLVLELQKENESLQSLKKLFNTACKQEFGYSVPEIHAILAKHNHTESAKTQSEQQPKFSSASDRQ